MAEKSAVAIFMPGGIGMTAKEYLNQIQLLNFEADECVAQIALLEETIYNLSNEKIIAALEDAVDELNEQHSSFVTKAHLMVSNLTNLDEPLECAVLAYRYHRDYSWSDIAERLAQTVSATYGTGGNNQPFVVESAGFCTEHSAQARGIGYEEEKSPTLRAGVVPATLKIRSGCPGGGKGNDD